MSRLGEPSELDDKLHFPIEELWRRVKRWARRNGKRWVSSYGVEGVAAA
jgi:hypothetical protein